jgi:hypothetical protein
LINKTFTFKLFSSDSNIWVFLSVNIIHNVVIGIINVPRKLRLRNILKFTLFTFRTVLHQYFGLCFRQCCIRQASFIISWINRFIFSEIFCEAQKKYMCVSDCVVLKIRVGRSG